MNDLDERIRALRERIATHQRIRARAEHERDAAKAALERARTALAEEFEVHTADDARAALATFETELANQINALEGDLDRMGA